MNPSDMVSTLCLHVEVVLLEMELVRFDTLPSSWSKLFWLKLSCENGLLLLLASDWKPATNNEKPALKIIYSRGIMPLQGPNSLKHQHEPEKKFSQFSWEIHFNQSQIYPCGMFCHATALTPVSLHPAQVVVSVPLTLTSTQQKI